MEGYILFLTLCIYLIAALKTKVSSIAILTKNKLSFIIASLPLKCWLVMTTGDENSNTESNICFNVSRSEEDEKEQQTKSKTTF